MPELPEVESVRRGLVQHAAGQRIHSVQTFGNRVIRYAPAGLQSVIGARIRAVARRGKFLWFELDDAAGSWAGNASSAAGAADGCGGPSLALVAHLGMSGQFRVDSEPERHLRARLLFENGTRLDFIDQRTFGYLAPAALVPTPDGDRGGEGSTGPYIPANIVHIARDVLDPALNVPEFERALGAKRTAVKTALLDQTLISGVGNIYADEALFRAGIHPRQPASTLKMVEITRLLDALGEVLREALRAGGTSFDALYVHVNGESGYFERSLRVYGRAGKQCLQCGGVVKRIMQGGRSASFCPCCQPLRRRKLR